MIEKILLIFFSLIYMWEYVKMVCFLDDFVLIGMILEELKQVMRCS